MNTSSRGGLPMPLWLQGIVEALQFLLLTGLTIIVSVIAVHYSGGFGAQNPRDSAALAGQAWLLTQGVPLTLTPVGGGGDPLPGTALSLTPLGAMLVPFFVLAWRSGRRLARACYTDQLWPVLLEVLVIAGVVNVTVATLSTTGQVRVDPLAAAFIPLLPLSTGLVIGARREAGSWSRLIGLDAVAWLRTHTGQVFRWAGTYVWTVLRAGCVTVVALLAVSAALLALNILVRWADIATAYEQLQADPVGAAAVTVAQMAYLPNLVLWSMSWLAGPGFALGVNFIVSPLLTAAGPLPTIPLLAAVPAPTSVGGMVFLFPVLAGCLGGWWFFRAGEDHLEDWLAIRLRVNWFATTAAALALGAFTGLVAGILSGVLGWACSGSGGFPRFSELGPNPWALGAWLAVEVGIGVAMGKLAAPSLEKALERRGQRSTFDPFA